MQRPLLLVIIGAVLGFGLGAVASRAPDASPIAAAAVSAPDTNGSALVVALGRVEAASEEIDVQAKRGGRLRAVLVDEGDRVTRGQVLAELDADEVLAAERAAAARLSIAEAERAAAARLSIAEAELERLVAGAREEERREARAVVAQTEASHRLALRDAERARALAAEGVISPQDVDRADRELAVAGARLEEARERSALVAAPARTDDRSRAEAAVRLARAQLDEARAYVADSTIRSPLDGRVVRRHKQGGESVSRDQPSPIVTLADTAPLRVRVEVDERDVARVAPGQTVYVTTETFGERRFPGRVLRVGERLGRKRIRTDNPAEREDRRVLETLVTLDDQARLPLDLRVTAFITVE